MTRHAIVAACLLGSSLALGGAEGPMDRVRALVEEKRRLQWENETLRQELAIASTPAPYIMVDPAAGTFEFRVRGKTHKTYRARSIEILRADGAPMPPAEARSLASGPVEVAEKAEGPPEMKPPEDPNGEAEIVGGDANTVKRSDAGILGIEAPTEYDVDLEGGIRLEVRSVRDRTRWERTRVALGGMGRALARTVNGWLGRSDRVPEGAPRARLVTTFDEATARALYHSLLPGEHLYFVPPPPPPVTLVASLGPTPVNAPSAGGEPGGKPRPEKVPIWRKAPR